MLSTTSLKQALLTSLRPLEIQREQLEIQNQQSRSDSISRNRSLLSSYLVLGMVIFLLIDTTPTILYFVVVFPFITGIILLLRKAARSTSETYTKNFEATVKQKAFCQLFQTWNTTSVGTFKKAFSRSTFNQSYLFSGERSYTGEAHCIATLEEERTIEFSELLVDHETLSNRQQHRKNSPASVFQGLFFIIRGKNILHQSNELILIKPKKQTILPPSSSTPHTSAILDADFIAAPSTPKTAFPLLDPYYTIKGKSNQQAQSYFSEDFQKTLYDIRVDLEQTLHLSIERNNIYFALSNPSRLWDLDLQQPLTDAKRLEDLAAYFELVFDVVDRIAKITSPTNS
ncbi:MAG: DUF3137 domain-containing protein [Aureispira sp.]